MGIGFYLLRYSDMFKPGLDPIKLLEPYAVKVARTVLKGGKIGKSYLS